MASPVKSEALSKKLILKSKSQLKPPSRPPRDGGTISRPVAQRIEHQKIAHTGSDNPEIEDIALILKKTKLGYNDIKETVKESIIFFDDQAERNKHFAEDLRMQLENKDKHWDDDHSILEACRHQNQYCKDLERQILKLSSQQMQHTE